MYKFLAQRGQHFKVYKTLKSLGCTRVTCTPYTGTRGNHGGCSDEQCCMQVVRSGYMVTAEIPEHMSSRMLDRILKAQGLA